MKNYIRSRQFQIMSSDNTIKDLKNKKEEKINLFTSKDVLINFLMED